MVRIRHGWLVVALGLVFTLVAACKKDETASGGDKSGMAGAGDQDLAFLPADSEIVLGIHLGQMQQSALWKQYIEPRTSKMMDADGQRMISEVKSKCGFDPMTAVKAVSVGVTGVSGGKPAFVVVAHGMEKTKMWACFDQMKDEMAKNGTEFSRDGDIGLFKSTRGMSGAVTFVNDNTMLMLLGDKADAAGVKAAAAGGSALKTSPAFADPFKKINTGDSFWGWASSKTKLFDRAAMVTGQPPQIVFGSINVTDGLALDLRARLDAPENATKVGAFLKSQLQQAAKMVDKLDVTNEASDIKISVVVSSQKLQDLITQFGGMARAFGGMGGE
jgi:hypothetical protein